MNVRKRSVAIEVVLTGMCALAGLWLGTTYAKIPAVVSTAAYYQGSMAPSVLLACGLGFTNLSRVADREQEYAPLLAFLEQRSDRFDCAEMPNDIVEVPFTALQAASRYLLLAVGLAWTVGGVSWSGLSWFYGVLYALVAALTYGAARAVVSRASSLLLVAAFITSALQLGNLPHLRDYLKVPFFLAMLVILLRVAVRPITSRALVLWSAAAGAVTGIGFGIRFDMVVFLAFFLGAVVVLLPGSPLAQWRSRLMAIGVAVAVFLVTALPILLAFQLGNNSWHVAILGFSDQHESSLGLRRMYQIGTIYYDGYVAAAVNSYWQRRTGSDALFVLDSPEYARAGAEYFREIGRTFPADLVARGWACVAAVARLGFDQVFLPHPFAEGTVIDRILDFRFAVSSRLLRAVPILTVLPLAASIGLAAWNARLSVLAVSAWLFFGGVSSTQYHARHIVHLEVLSLLLAVVVLEWASRAASRVVKSRKLMPAAAHTKPQLLPVIWVTAVIMLVFVVPLAALRAIQGPTVRRLFSSYAEKLTQPQPFAVERRTGDVVLVTQSTSPSNPNSRLQTHFFAADFDAARCPFYRVTPTIRYVTSQTGNDFSRQLAVTVPETGTARAWFAAYDFDNHAGDTYRFAGLEMAAAQLPCLSSFSQVKQVGSLGLLVDAVLPPQWDQGRLYAMFQRWESDPVNPVPRLTYTIPEALPVRTKIRTRPLVPLGQATDYRGGIVTIEANHRIVARGSTNPVGYLVSWLPATKTKHALLVAEGHLVTGGLTIGLEHNQTWAAAVQVITPGPFRVAIEAPTDGEFRPVIANLSGLSRSTRFEIDRIGWIQ